MKKLIFRFWKNNILISILLFILYRVFIAESNTTDDSFLGTVIYIMEILLNLGFSIVYFIAMLICSAAFFLNLIPKIVQRYFLSFLSFLGLPIIGVTCIAIVVIRNYLTFQYSPFITLFCFSLIYLFVTVFQFFRFRRKVEVLHNNLVPEKL
ncbi:hypothetical protein ACJVDH_19815 [Pedobacter sp. AW1-32]|uniref:hypothetical protein n=1 Tax=Pedobacter sp. AW1-32 TaxID=3383026 RepID=UPI003FEF05F5